MSYAPYPAYKDSGVPWLGQVPDGWEVKRLRYASKLADERLPYDEVQRPYVGLENIESWTGKRIVDDEARADGIVALFERGDVLFGKLRPYLAKVHRAEEAGCSSTEALILRGKSGLDTHFLKYFMLSPAFIDEVNATTYGAKMPRANWSDVGGLPVSLPPIEEQTAIADFLDKKTAEIDDLIAKKEELLRLLAEQRTALITHAVTKGLTPNAPMKPSGIDWLGEVPMGWEVKRLKHLTRIERGKFSFRPRNAPHLYDGEFPFIQTGDIARASKILNKWKQTLSDKGRLVSRSFPSGTVVMAIAANVGDVAILDFEAYAPDSIVGFNPSNKISTEFLYHSLIAAVRQLEAATVTNTQGNLNIERVGDTFVAVPDLNSQHSILKELDQRGEASDQIVTKTQDAIAHLREYRTALITNAVTGKIKVA